MLKIKNVSASYGTRQVIDDISFDLHKGEIVIVVGPNGSGKTTLIRVITGAIKPDKGSVLLNGQPFNQLEPSERAKIVALVSQRSVIPEGFTVYETVALGRTPYLDWAGTLSTLTKKDQNLIRNALEATSTLAISQSLLQALSGGEQQRVKLARALAQDTPILILDEPSAHLDLKYSLELLSMVRTLGHDRQKSVLMVLHDLNLTARLADRVILLDHGKIKAEGSPADVLTPENLESVYKVPMQCFYPENSAVPLILVDPNSVL